MGQLDDALGELNDELDAAERYLESFGIGERVAVPFEDGSLLVFAKRGDAWCLLVEAGAGTSLLTSVSKKKRLEAVPLLPRLLEAMRAAEKVRLDEVRAAVAALRRFRGAPTNGVPQ